MSSLRGKVTFVTGASSGLGAETVRLLSREGATVFGIARDTERLAEVFSDVAEAHDTALLPFLLEPIATDRDAFLPDNLHPDAEAQPALRDHVWTALAPLLD